VKILEDVVEASERCGLAPGVHSTAETIEKVLEMGFRFCAIDADSTFLTRDAEAALRAARAKVRGRDSSP